MREVEEEEEEDFLSSESDLERIREEGRIERRRRMRKQEEFSKYKVNERNEGGRGVGSRIRRRGGAKRR